MRILICPLDWGIGHTSRMIPVAARLMNEGHDVVFGVSERQAAFLRTDLTRAAVIHFPGFTTRYSRVLPMYLYTAFRIPAFIISLVREHRRLRYLLATEHFDMVISDNRMGLWNRGVRTVYVTHMLRIPMPPMLRFLEPAGVLIHRLFINRFDECHIPDLPHEGNLSGRLSHNVTLPANASYIGILSKYDLCSPSEMEIPTELRTLTGGRWSVLILSGPEPQRSLLREKITGEWDHREGTLVVMEGRPDNNLHITCNEGIVSVPHLPPCALAALLKGSRRIISRSGYTTIMELASLGRLASRATLLPPPGQTEQEYLATRLPS
jgi:hypothetical protein